MKVSHKTGKNFVISQQVIQYFTVILLSHESTTYRSPQYPFLSDDNPNKMANFNYNISAPTDPTANRRTMSQASQLNPAKLMMGLIDAQDNDHDMKSLTPTSSSTHSNADGRSSARKRSSEGEKGINTSEDGKRKKKAAQSDDRWSKRFSWPDELHRDFVAAIFDVGLKHSSPSSILEHMPKNELITTERIKSHLQKYRLHRLKSKKEFMGCYESSIQKFKNGTFDADPQSLKSAEVAAHLSYNSITDSEEPDDIYRETLLQGGVLQLPILTEDEKKSPVGASMGYMLGLFFSLKQQLYSLRGSEVSESRMSPSAKQQTLVEAGGPNSLALKDSFFTSVSTHEKNGVFHSSLLTMNPLEETNNMKREMQHHINFQNNLRRMKEQEFTKCMTQNGDQLPYGQPNGFKANASSKNWNGVTQQKDLSGQGNITHQDGRNYGEDAMLLMKGESRDSAAVADDLWNTDGVDEAFLFEFLKDDH